MFNFVLFTVKHVEKKIFINITKHYTAIKILFKIATTSSEHISNPLYPNNKTIIRL